jgi:hypothetical protein
MQDPVLNLFKDQLTTELKHLADSRRYLNLVSQKPDPGVAFPHWYFERIEQFERSEADTLITDGFDDEKIDAIHISDDEDEVRFFQFKNPVSRLKGIDDAAIDGLLTTIDLFLNSSRKKTALDEIFIEIRSAIRTSYKIVFITSGDGLAPKQKQRIEEKLKIWNGPTRTAFDYEVLTLASLSDKVYVQNVPTVNSKIELKLDTPPYQTKVNDHKSLVCHIDGKSLANEYSKFGEKLLQQNIRNTEGATPSNKAIYRTATSNDSDSFYFYNNGVTIICDDWDYDQPSWRLSITRPQIVNGGQTLRQISSAARDHKLRDDVKVLLRVISIGDDREFAGNVAVNLNNQTIVRSSFLKSNHPVFIQMQHALLPLGWYFERKPGDWENLTQMEKTDLLSKIQNENKIIQMQTGCQAYCAIYLQDIDLAKKNPKNIFLAKRSGGRFEDVATTALTAQRMISAFSILQYVEAHLQKLKEIRRIEQPQKRQLDLAKLLSIRKPAPYSELRKMLPQASLFVAALVAHQLGENIDVFPPENLSDKLVAKAILHTFAVGSKTDGAWATLLKSQSFLEAVKKKFKKTPLTKKKLSS